MNAPVNAERLALVDNSVNLGIDLVNHFYIPDVLAIGDLFVKAGYVDGGGLAGQRVLSFGEFPEERYSGVANGDYFKNLLVKSNGIVENFGQGVTKASFYPLEGKDLGDPNVLAEGVEHAWYNYPENNKDLHPWNGVTVPQYTAPKEGTKTDWKYLDETGKYSWVKTPKWNGKVAEVGPLAKYIVVYTKVKQGVIQQPTWAEKLIVDQIDAVSRLLNLPPETWMPTTVGRTAVRGLDAQLSAYINKYFLDKLINNIKAGDTTVANMALWDPATWPKEAKGVGLHEAPRGGLSHWITIKNGKIDNYHNISANSILQRT
jgi:hydrogenase large subunit